MSPAESSHVVLVVDDEAMIRRMLVDNLIRRGFAAIGAEDADHALRVMQQRFDVRAVITDIKMPGSMDGLALAHVLRDRDPSLILLISSGGLVPASKDLPAAARFFSKPYRVGRLTEELNCLFDRARSSLMAGEADGVRESMGSSEG